MSSAAKTVPTRASPITPAAIGTVPSVSGRPLRHGLQRARPNCCRCRTSTQCSRCRPRSARSPTRTSPRSTDYCSRPRPRCSPPLPPIPSTSAPASASPPSCTPGVRTSSIIPMFIASCQAVAYRRMASVGLPASPASFFRSAYSPACSGACSCRVLKPCTPPASCSSSPISALSRMRTRSERTSRRCARLNGSSMPKSPSPVPSRSWPISRYTHRVAIANSRLLDLDETHVSFRWKDYRESGAHKSKVMRLDVGEFMRRFLLHVLPSRFHRIRHYGLFANGHRADKLTLCRRVLDVPSAPTHRDNDDNAPAGSNHELPPCPCCGGRMIIIEVFDGPLSRPSHVRRLDGL